MSKNRGLDDWLSIDESASTTNDLTYSDITESVLNRSANNASVRSENEGEQPTEGKVSLEKGFNWTGKLTYTLESTLYFRNRHSPFV